MRDTPGLPGAPDHGLRSVLLLAGVVLIAANLRPAIASVSPLLGRIGDQLGLGHYGETWLATIPVICFAALAPLAPPLQRRLGLERAMLALLVALGLGLAFRLAGGAVLLYCGTVIATAAIAIGNVLLPAIVKRDFSSAVGLVTGLYVTALNAAAALASALSVPIADAGFGWRGALGVWLLPAVVAVLLWLPQLSHAAHRLALPYRAGAFRRLVRAPLAWHVAMFMGLQSLGFYSTLSWLPSILQADGVRPAVAGLMLSVSIIIAIPASLVTPGIAARRADQRGLLVAILAVTAIGYALVLLAPRLLGWPAIVLIGIGQGGAFPLALTLMVLRSKDGATAMGVSAFAQTLGYAVSIAGPLGMGALHAMTGRWQASMLFLMATMIPELLFGLGATRDRTISL